MSLGRCLTDLVGKKLISSERAEQLGGVYDELVTQYEARYGREAAEAMATEKALLLAEDDHLHRKRQMLLAAQKQGEWLASMRAASGDGNPLDRGVAEQFVVDMDNHRRAVRAQAFGMLDGLLAKFRRTVSGEVRNRAELGQVLDELWGRDSGNLNAKELARAWREGAEWLRSRYNAAGGRIAKLETWRLPQVHDMRTVRDAGYAAWRDFTLPLLDRGAMIDRDTGEPFSDGKLELILKDMWEAIATDGWTRNNPSGSPSGFGAMANRRADHRVLHFGSPEGWTAYADRFGGKSNGFDAMLAHVEGMTRDIAAMERMGPNPNATLRFQQDWLRKSAAEGLQTGRAGDRAIDDANSGAAQIERLYDEFTGANNRPERRRLALGFSIFRAQQVAAKLGGAVLSVGGDFGTTLATAKFDGLPAAKILGRYASLLNPASAADRELAGRLSLVADSWTAASAGQWRLTGEEIANETARRMAEGVLRVSGLVAHTDHLRTAFGMETLATLTSARGSKFGELDAPVRRMLERYGIAEGRWDELRAIEPVEDNGATWIYPEQVAKSDQALGDDLMRMLVSEADYAVPVPDLRTRTIVDANLPRGTWKGEILRSTFLFKGFPLSILMLHGRRMMEEATRGNLAYGAAVGGGLAVRYGLSLMALTTIGGALSLQLKQIAAGKDPQDMTTAAFWGKAAVQGGGLGIFGDLINSAHNRFGGGMLQTLAGPGAQLLDNSVGATVRNVTAEVDGDPETESQWAKDAAKLALHETPGLSLFYIRLAFERTLGDMVQAWTDEDVGQSYARLDRYAQEQGTAYWAPPGALTGRPNAAIRAPNLGNATGDGATAEAPQPY